MRIALFLFDPAGWGHLDSSGKERIGFMDGVAGPQCFSFFPSVGIGQVVPQNTLEDLSMKQQIGLIIIIEYFFGGFGGNGSLIEYLSCRRSE